MPNNLDIQQQLNALLEDQSKMLESQSKALRDQVSLTRELVSNLSKINFRGVADSAEEAQEAISKVQESTSQLGGESQGIFEKMKGAIGEAAKKMLGLDERTVETIKHVGKFGFVAGSAFHGFTQGLKYSVNLMGSVLSLGKGMLGFMGNLAASIIAIPFKMLTGLITMADTGGSNELQQALEDIRKEFGSLRETTGKAVVDMARNMKGQLANTGLSVYRIFGNLAERLKYMQEYAHNLGVLFGVLAGQFVKNAEAIGAYYKGLGLTEEGQKAVAARAYATGTAVTEELRQIGNFSLQLGKAFNLSSKEISRDMATMMADFRNFGSLSTKEIGQASVYFRRLGVELKSVLGVIEKYDNFEDAASGAAHLSQAFGLNLDALQLMKAQNPAERIEMMRKAFFAAGRSVETMTRQERALLAQQTGLSDDALGLVFSLKNQGLSYAEVQKKSDAAQKKQLSQVQVLQKLSDAIERLVKSGSAGMGGLLDRFIQGFSVGIRRSWEFQRLMWNLQRVLYIVYYAGIRVGRAFVDAFPGVRNILGGLRDIFNPHKWRESMNNVVQIFKQFFRDLADPQNKQAAVTRLFNALKNNFLNFFNRSTPAGRRVIEGFRSFFVALGDIAGGLVRIALRGLTDGIRQIINLITNPPHIGGAVGRAGGLISQIFSPIVDAIRENWRPLWQAIKDLFSLAFNRIKPWLIREAPLLLGTLFGPAILGVVGRTLLSTAIVGMFRSAFGAGSPAVSAGSSIVGAGLRRIFGGAREVAGAPQTRGTAAAMQAGSRQAQSAAEAGQAIEQTQQVSARSIGQKLINLGLVMVAMAGFMYMIFRFAKAIEENHISLKSVAAASLAMVATAMAAVGMSYAVKALAEMPDIKGKATNILLGLLAIGVVGAALAFGALGLIRLFRHVNLSDAAKAGVIMGGVTALFLAAAAATVVAAGVGVIAAAGGGLGAAAIALGLTVIATVVAGMATGALAIMRSINQVRVGPDFEMKAKAFVGIIEAIGSFAGNIARIVEATRPSFFSFRNAEREQRETLATVQRVVDSMGAQLTNIINTVSEAINKISGGEERLKAAESLGQLLSGVAELGRVLQPPTEALQASGFDRIFRNSEAISQQVNVVADYVVGVGNSLRQFIHAVANIVTGELAHGITEEQKRAVEVIPGVLGALGQFARAFMPSPTLIQELNKGASFSGQLQNIQNYVQSVLHQLIDTDILGQVATAITTIIKQIGGANFTPRQVQVLQTVLPVFTAAFQGVANIGSALTNLAQNQGDIAANINAATQFVQAIVSVLSDRLPAISTAMTEAFGSMSPQLARAVKGGAEAFTNVLTGVRAIADTPVEHLGGLDAKFNALVPALRSTQAGVEGIAFILARSTHFGSNVEALVRQVEQAQITRGAHAITQIVHSINETSEALAGVHEVSINTQLNHLVENLGLRTSGEYQIQNGNFTLNVTVNVNLEAEGFERALSSRPGGSHFAIGRPFTSV